MMFISCSTYFLKSPYANVPYAETNHQCLKRPRFYKTAVVVSGEAVSLAPAHQRLVVCHLDKPFCPSDSDRPMPW